MPKPNKSEGEFVCEELSQKANKALKTRYRKDDRKRLEDNIKDRKDVPQTHKYLR